MTAEVSTAVLLSVLSATMSVTVIIVVSWNVEVVELTGVEDVVVFSVEAGLVSTFVNDSGD
jgi:hypothetical protein